MNAQVLTAASSVVDGGGVITKRTGTVRRNNRAVFDDQGFFHPLGMTFFWAMRGWRSERDRFLRNLDWIVANGPVDYLRILSYVDWGTDLGIYTDWPDYDAVFVGTMKAITERGMRAELCAFGSPYGAPQSHCHRLSSLAQYFPGGFMNGEVWNEWSQNGGDIQTMKDCARILMAESGIPLIALSSSIMDDPIVDATAECGAPLGTDHSDRAEGDDGWRMVRQGYAANEGKTRPFVFSGNEPPGVNSSVNQLESPLQLAMLRATQVQSGGALWVLHVGDMVMGIEDPAHGRHPNLWEVDNLPAILKAVKAVDVWLPDGVENWRPKSAGNANILPQALVPDIPGWEGPNGEGVNRFYSSFDGPRVVQVLDGVKGNRTMTSRLDHTADYILNNPETDEEIAITLDPGQSFVLNGRADGMTGFVVNAIQR